MLKTIKDIKDHLHFTFVFFGTGKWVGAYFISAFPLFFSLLAFGAMLYTVLIAHKAVALSDLHFVSILFLSSFVLPALSVLHAWFYVRKPIYNKQFLLDWQLATQAEGKDSFSFEHEETLENECLLCKLNPKSMFGLRHEKRAVKIANTDPPLKTGDRKLDLWKIYIWENSFEKGFKHTLTDIDSIKRKEREQLLKATENVKIYIND